MRRINFITLLFISLLPANAWSVTPTVSSVSGTVATGQSLSITGANMVSENKAIWDYFHTHFPTADGFEGASPTADGLYQGPMEAVYDTTVKLMGSKSARFHPQLGPSSENVASYNALALESPTSDMWFRYYVRYNAANNIWWDNYAKQLYLMGIGGNYYLDVAGGSSMPSQMKTTVGSNGTDSYGSIPSGKMVNDRWYLMEVHVVNGSVFDVYMDNQKIITTPSSVLNENITNHYVLFGVPNAKASPSGLNVYCWWDGLVSSKARVYAASTVEISNSAVYHGGTYLYQEPTYISDGNIQIKVNITGLGSGPLYLWVTNNRQEHVAVPFNLSGSDSGDITKPVTAASPVTGSYASTQTIILNATDNVAVASTSYCWGASCTPSTDYTGAIPIVNGTLGYRSVDVNGNIESTKYSVYSVVETSVPPVILSAYPYGTLAYGTTSATLGVVTDKAATCKYGHSEVAYDSLPYTFATTNGTIHSSSLSGLSAGVDYTYHMLCRDSLGNDSNTAQTTFNISATQTGGIILQENFDNNSFASRGWYDETNHGTIAAGGFTGNCLQWAWSSAASKPLNGDAIRHAFAATDEMYLTYYVKFQSTWRGSQQTYHPHLFYLLSDLEPAYSGLSANYLTVYSEFISSIGAPYNIHPSWSSQDTLNTNVSLGSVPNNITGVTENRSVNYCNGYKAGQDQGQSRDCYSPAAGMWYSATTWEDTAHNITKDTWHKVVVRFKMNTVTGGVANTDGIMQEWIDDILVFDKTTIVYRTNQHATMKWDKIVLAPYIGDGSPIAQTMWIDDLSISTNVTGSDPTPLRYILKLNAVGSGGQIYLAVPN